MKGKTLRKDESRKRREKCQQPVHEFSLCGRSLSVVLNDRLIIDLLIDQVT